MLTLSSVSFRQRFLTTVVLVPIVLLLVMVVNSAVLAGIILSVVMLAAYEWTALIPLQKPMAKVVFLVTLLIVLYGFLYGILYAGLLEIIVKGYVLFGVGVWVLLLFCVMGYPKSQRYWGHEFVTTVLAFIILSVVFTSIIALYQISQSRWLCLYVLGLVCSADIGAYLSGQIWGRHKLIPNVSPGKTWEGVLGGILFSMAVSLCAGFYFRPAYWGFWLGLAGLTACISILGDLFISMLKRRVNIKDTGRIFPGHGGLLDRIDGLLAAFPLFYVSYSYLNYLSYLQSGM